MQRVKSDIFRNKSYNNAPVTLLEIHLIHRKRAAAQLPHIPTSPQWEGIYLSIAAKHWTCYILC